MTGMAGELGHMTVDPNGPPCGCSSSGCLEQFASATAIKRMALEAISAGSAPELGKAMSANPEFSAKLVFQMAMNGDTAAQQIFRKVGWALGIALADVVNAFNLPIYVIGGGVAAGWEAFAPAMLDELKQRSFVFRATQSANSRRKTLITRALLGSDAGLIGAAYLPIQAQES
jgi:glucokinase